MSDKPNKADNLQPSWAAHELFALGLTLLLAVWIMVKYGGDTAPADHRDARAADRAAKRAELDAADEKALGSYGVVDVKNGVYRVPIQNSMTTIENTYLKSSSFSQLVADRLLTPEQIGAKLFEAKTCFTCHKVPGNPISGVAGTVFNAPKFTGNFWGSKRVVTLGIGGAELTVDFDEKYVEESIRKPSAKISKGTLVPQGLTMSPMAAIEVTDDELAYIIAFLKSVNGKE